MRVNLFHFSIDTPIFKSFLKYLKARTSVPEVVCKKTIFKIHRKTTVLESLLNKSLAVNFFQKMFLVKMVVVVE